MPDLRLKLSRVGLAVAAGLLLFSACAKARILPPTSPFPPASRWEFPLELAVVPPLASDGTLVFAALSDGSLVALDAATGKSAWSRTGTSPALVAARPGSVVLVEKGGIVWGLSTEDGSARWKTTTGVSDVRSVRLDGNRIFLGGASGFASIMVTTGELQFDLASTDVRDIDAAGSFLAAIEEGALQLRDRDTGRIRYRLASPEGSFGAPAVFSDGRIVLGSGNRLVRAVSPEGKFTWRFKVGAVVKHRPLDFGDSKRVGVLSFEAVFYELSLGGGDMRRRALLTSRPFAAPYLEGGRIWAPVFEDELSALEPRTSRLLGRTRFGGSFLAPPILAAGHVVAEVSSPRRLVGLGIRPIP